MLPVLIERKWIFNFRVEMTSPRGFRYEASAHLPQVAFFKALGDWAKANVPFVSSDLAFAKTLPAVDVMPRGLSKDMAAYMRFRRSHV